MNSTLVITSNVRHLVGSSALARRLNFGKPPSISPAETVSPCFRNVLRSIASPFPYNRVFQYPYKRPLRAFCQLETVESSREASAMSCDELNRQARTSNLFFRFRLAASPDFIFK